MTFKRWLPTFLAFPLGGLLAIETVGGLHDPASAAAGGLVAGAVIGAGQGVALRAQGAGVRWAVLTAAAMAVGSAVAAVITGAGTDVADVVVAGAITGAAVGAAQARVLGGGPRVALAWTAATAAAWTLGWLTTAATIVDLDRGYAIFGASGALVATVITGLALRRLPVRVAAGA